MNNPKGILKAILTVIIGGGLGSQLPDIGADPETTQWVAGLATAIIGLVGLFLRRPQDDAPPKP